MWLGKVDVDGNGIVMFDPRVVEAWRPDMKEGTDLFTEFTTTNVGDEVLARGIMVPILAIDDGGYSVVVRRVDEPEGLEGTLIVENGVFPLAVTERVVVADLAVLRHWLRDVGWTSVAIPPGNYGVTVRGLRRMSADQKSLEAMGYEYVLKPELALPAVTANTARNMRVMNWWPKRKPARRP